jgi:aryl-alcohol dehydrogenase-like predicted oxidoreductase
MNRRKWLGLSLGAGAGLALEPRLLWAARQQLITRAIPSTGERLPIVGLGSSATFRQVARSEDVSALRGVLRTMVERGGRVFDTAPSYGASEEVAGRIAGEENLTDRIFWATKMNVQGPAGTLDPAVARQQMEASLQRIGKRPLDLIQVHGLAGAPTQVGMLREMKQSGRIRYIGVTTTSPQQYEQLQQIMRAEPLDFIGIDYAVDNRDIEEHILPLAQDRGIGVMVYMPFGRARLWSRIGDRPLPDWAQEFDAHSWAQFMIKYVASHPAVTVVTPSTSKPDNMADNVGAAFGRLPDEAMRRRMAEYADALPAAPAAAGPAPAGPAVVVPAAILDRYAGVYETASGFTLTLRRAGAGLVAQPASMPEAALVAQSETRFRDPRGPVHRVPARRRRHGDRSHPGAGQPAHAGSARPVAAGEVVGATDTLRARNRRGRSSCDRRT